jgi:hypothetical protein
MARLGSLTTEYSARVYLHSIGEQTMLTVYEVAKKAKRSGRVFKVAVLGKPVDVTNRKGKVVGFKLDYSDLKEVREQELRDIADSFEHNICDVLIAGIERLNHRKASGGGMKDVIVARLLSDGILANEEDVKKRSAGISSIATGILTTFRDKQRLGKEISLETVYANYLA